MKLLCDVCGADEAALLCCADEAALCYCCDRRVHRATKLAGKHPRFSLLPYTQTHPLCDICQEKRGIVFCTEDRAILCHECDSPIHAANGLTMKHSRFILTGIGLSSASITASSHSSEQSINKKKVSHSQLFSSPTVECSSTSSISDYLIKMLPGYQVEEFLLDDSMNYTAGDVFYQSDALAPSVEANLAAGNIGAAHNSPWPIVPDATLHIHHATLIISATAVAAGANVVNESSNMKTIGAYNLLAYPAVTTVQVFAKSRGLLRKCSLCLSLPGSNKRPCRASAWNF
ncbi:B-box zinc finger protein 20-like [Dendrobium catenatum]|uniref:B-box zinc finger protein 20-like n=1 Tax=Dendrobium catenatum TaxID=906689 RepID=UPI0010A097C4|nr:B-box zinc finger protein 20-like [Dendrobium catenatum]